MRLLALLAGLLLAATVARAEWPPEAPDPPPEWDPRLIEQLTPELSQSMQDVPRGMRVLALAEYSFGTAVGADGSIYFTEFNRQRLRRLRPDGVVETVLSGYPGIYGVVVDPDGTIYIGIDGGDAAPVSDSGVRRIRTDGTVDWIINGLRRPRQLTLDASGNVLAVFEIGQIWRWNKATGTRSLVAGGLVTPQGVAGGADGSIYFSLYSTMGATGVLLERGKVMRRAPNGVVTELASGFSRARGLAYSPVEDCVYLVTEANVWDQGNSAQLARITPTGEVDIVTQGFDYPQFPACRADGRVVFTCARDYTLVEHDPFAVTTLSSWSGPAGVQVFAENGTFVPGDLGTGPGYPIRILMEDLAIEGRLHPADPAQRMALWIRAPQELFSLSLEQLPEQTPEAPGPGFYEVPAMEPRATVGVATVPRALALRRHDRCRWPMTYPDGVETAAPDFNESPEAYLAYIEWTPDVAPLAAPTPIFDDGVMQIIPATPTNWALRGAWGAAGQAHANLGLASTDFLPASHGVLHLGHRAGELLNAYVTWHSIGTFRADDARYVIHDDTGVLAMQPVNQRLLAGGEASPGDTMAGWQRIGEGPVLLTSSSRLRVSQEAPISSGTEYLHIDATMLTEAAVLDVPVASTQSGAQFPAMSVASTGPTGYGHHWGMQGAGYRTLPGGAGLHRVSLAAEEPPGPRVVEVSWVYRGAPDAHDAAARVRVNGELLAVTIDQNKGASAQEDPFVPGNSVGSFSGFLELPGLHHHSAAAPLLIEVLSGDGSTAPLAFDMVRVRPAPVDAGSNWLLR